MVLKRDSITNFLYIIITIIISILVFIGYFDIYQKDQAQKLSLKQYEDSLSLLKSNITELQSAIDILNKGGGGSENPFVSTTPVSFPVTEDVIVSSIVLGLIFFGLTIFAVFGSQNYYVKQFFKSVTTSISNCTANEKFLDENLDQHRKLTGDYFNYLVHNFRCLKSSIFNSTGDSVVDSSSLCGSMDAHIENLAEFRDLLLELGEEFFFQLDGQNFGALMKENGLLLDQVAQHLAVLGAKNSEVYYLVSLMQDAQINFVIATTIIG
jgi:hypothetical protein